MINNIVLGTSETTIYQALVGTSFAMLSLIFCNVTGIDQSITVYAYPTGGSASDSSTIIKSLLIPPLDSFVWDANEKFILGAQDKISGIATNASAITVTTNGMPI